MVDLRIEVGSGRYPPGQIMGPAPPAPSTYTRFLTETLHLSDYDLEAQAGLARMVTETLHLSDPLARPQITPIARALAETLHVVQIGPPLRNMVTGGAGTGVLFDMDYSTNASNFPFLETNDCWSLTRLPTGGPSGQPAFRLTQSSACTHPEGQHYWGHRGSVLSGSEIPTWSQVRYLRFRLKMSASNNYRNVSGGHTSNKLIFMHEGCSGGNCRIIINQDAQRDASTWSLLVGTDGGVDQIFVSGLANGVWLNIQLKFTYSSAFNVANGGTAIYINNNNQGSPTASNTRILNAPGSEGHLGIGEFSNGVLASDGVFIYEHADYEYADTFDAGWHS